jgi:hypothetical protein
MYRSAPPRKPSLKKRVTSYRNLPGYPSIVEPPAPPLAYQIRTDDLVADADQVVGEGLDGLCRVAGLHVLAVVADKDGLFGLGDADAYLPLRIAKEDGLADLFPWRVVARRVKGKSVPGERTGSHHRSSQLRSACQQ